jgi:hypothetical protein
MSMCPLFCCSSLCLLLYHNRFLQWLSEPCCLVGWSHATMLGRTPAGFCHEVARAMCRPAVIESEAPETGEADIAAAQEQRSVSPAQHSVPLQRRRRSSMADHTGRLLMDDSEENLAMLAPAGGLAPPSSPQDSSAGRGGYAGMPRHAVCNLMPCLYHSKAASLCCCCWGITSG